MANNKHTKTLEILLSSLSSEIAKRKAEEGDEEAADTFEMLEVPSEIDGAPVAFCPDEYL